VYDAARDRMIVFGPGNDVWALTWTIPVSAGPSPVTASALLGPPAPNPARGGVTLAFTLPGEGHARLRVYDVHGRLVRTLAEGDRAVGTVTVRWDGRDAAGARVRPGVYLVQLVTSEASDVRRLVMLE
jgi:hypothetical protein